MTVKINHFIKILVLTAVIEASSIVSVQASLQDDIRYQNKADFICGITGQDSELRTRHDVLITMFNPNDFPVMVNNFISLDAEVSLIKPDLNDRYLNILLSPKRNFVISCHDIEDMFFPDHADNQQSQEYFKGYMHSQSRGYLGIAFNYINSSILKSNNLQGRQNEKN